MNKKLLSAAICVAVISTPLLADDEEHAGKSPMKMDSSMPMHDKEKCEMMSKMKPMMQMREKHMKTMEERLANIEDLLRQLVELQKREHAEH